MSAPAEAAPARLRRWPRRLLIGLNVFVALCVLMVGAAYALVVTKWGNVNVQAGIRDVLTDDPPGVPEDPGDVMNVLLVGSDTRQNISEDERVKFDDAKQPVTGQRSDTIMILRVDPRAQKASMLSIPRDLYVPIAGRTTKRGNPVTARINTAFEGEDGPATLIKTIQQNLKIDIDHYLQVDFNGFRGIVETVGGVPVYFPAPARDRVSGLLVEEAGCVKLDGDGALAYVRSRHYETQENGRWRPEGGIPDFNRINRQQDFIRRMMSKAISRAPKNPLVAYRLLDKGVQNLTKDPAFSVHDMRRLAWSFRSLDPAKVEMLTLPTTPVRRNGADVLELKEPEASQVIEQFRGEPPEAPGVPVDVLPSTVNVRILNGSGVTGQASAAAQALAAEGFQVAGTGNADKRYDRNVVVYAAGQRDKAAAVASFLVGGAELQQDGSLEGVDAVLLTGAQFDGIRDPAAAPSTSAPATSTTTAPPQDVPQQPQC